MGNGNAIVYAYMEERFVKVGECVNPPLKERLDLGWHNHFCKGLYFRVNARISRRTLARWFGKKPKYTYRTNKKR